MLLYILDVFVTYRMSNANGSVYDIRNANEVIIVNSSRRPEQGNSYSRDLFVFLMGTGVGIVFGIWLMRRPHPLRRWVYTVIWFFLRR